MDLRENFDVPEENMRSLWAGIQKHLFTALPVIVSEDSDGKTASLQIAIKRTIEDKTYNTTTYQDFPLLVDVPIHFHGGGGLTAATHPVKQGDEGMAIFSSRALDFWFQSGGTQQQVFNRMHSLADAMYVPGLRSMPRELKQISTTSAQIRTDDKRAVIDHDPVAGTHIKNVDPTTAPASDSFDPFASAATFFEHIVHPTNGVAANATDGGTTHSHTVDHVNGAAMSANNEQHQVKAHPTQGALLSAENGAHTVTASPTGVSLQSSIAIALLAPAVSMPSGSLGSSALASGAASDNVGELGGDLSGTLPNPQVVSILNVSDANMLTNAANDAAAAAAGVAVGFLYRNGSALMARIA